MESKGTESNDLGPNERDPSQENTDPTQKPQQTSPQDNNETSRKRDHSTPLTLLAVSFKEAALDSPTFRASMNHLHDQFESVDRWIDSFNKATLRMSQEMDVLQEIVNYTISWFVPEFVTQGLVDHDHTMLVMRRFAEAQRFFWTGVISRVKSQSAKSLEALGEFQRADLRSYKDCRRNFEAAQTRFDQVLARYASMSKSKEPSSLREDAFQVSEARKAYTKASFDLCCISATVQRTLDKIIIDTLTDPWLLKNSSLAITSPKYQRLGVDMHRLKSWSKVVCQSLKPIEAEMLKARKEMESQTLNKAVPSRELNDYTVESSTVTHFVPDNKNSSAEKHGWVFVKTTVKPARQAWVRRWAFVKNGMFGWLVLSPSKTYVQESDKIGVLLCNVSPEPNEDRRFCFEVRTKDTTLIMQAETLADLKSWLQVFEVSKRLVIQHDRDFDMSFAFQRVFPLIPEFASTQHTSTDHELTHNRTNSDGVTIMGSSAERPSVEMARRAAGLLQSPDASSIQNLMTSGKSDLTGPMADSDSNFSTVGPFGAALAPSPLLNTPMPTSMTKESIVANSFVTPTMVPSALTANYWGSVNWALYIKSTHQLGPRVDVIGNSNTEDGSKPKTQGPNPGFVTSNMDNSYPPNYPADLRAQDAQMRAIFQTMVDNDPMDRVVMVFRALVSPNSKQELPARIFVTPKNLYMYSNTFGFSAVVKKPMKEVISVEGHASTSWDTLYIVDDRGISSLCRVFLDSGRMIQKRLQFLADVHLESNSGNKEDSMADKSLEFFIEKLKNISGGPAASTAAATTNNSDDNSDGAMEILQRHLTYKPNNNKDTTKIKEPARSVDITKTMDRLLIQKDYDVPAKALFHVVFGEASNVFHYEGSSFYRRADLQVKPWKLNHGHMEREIRFRLESNGVLVNDSEQSKGIVVQRIEKVEDNASYIVYDRRPPWELPHGDVFYIATRYVITADPNQKSRCKFEIYTSIEWVKSGKLTKTIVENLVYHHYGLECKMLLKRINDCREKLGKRGMTVTAIRLFGKLGKPTEEQQQQEKEQQDSIEGTEPENTGRPSNEGVRLSGYSYFGSIYELTVGWIVSVISSICLVTIRVTKAVYHEFSVNKLLLLALGVSVLTNMFLSGKTGAAYWAERHAVQISHDLSVTPSSSDTVMKRSLHLSDIDELVQSGSLAHGPSNPCYSKFQSLVYTPFDSVNIDMVDIPLDMDRASLEFSQRVHEIRNELGIKRNRLIISLKSLNRLEDELMREEWRQWLLSEVHLCGLVRDRQSSSNESNQLHSYCQSCFNEWRHVSDEFSESS